MLSLGTISIGRHARIKSFTASLPAPLLIPFIQDLNSTLIHIKRSCSVRLKYSKLFKEDLKTLRQGAKASSTFTQSHRREKGQIPLPCYAECPGLM